jgi:hypothetical protein
MNTESCAWSFCNGHEQPCKDLSCRLCHVTCELEDVKRSPYSKSLKWKEQLVTI